MSSTPATAIDLRTINPRERHALVRGRFDALRAGESLHLVNDHDPIPLQDQFQQRAAGRFAWSYLEAGPARWRVQIARLAAAERPDGIASPARSDACCAGGARCGG